MHYDGLFRWALHLRCLASAGESSSQAALACDLSHAAAALYRDEPGDALERMLELTQRDGEFGASHAQHDLYDQIMVVAAQSLGDLPRVRQLSKARLSTRVWDSSSSAAFEYQSRLVDGIEYATAVRDALAPGVVEDFVPCSTGAAAKPHVWSRSDNPTLSARQSGLRVVSDQRLSKAFFFPRFT